MRLAISMILLIGACGGGGSHHAVDGGGGSGGDGGGSGDGGPGDGPVPMDAPETCDPTGTPHLTSSLDARARATLDTLAFDGTSVMASWGIYPGHGFGKQVWARTLNGSVVDHGDFPASVTGGQLYAFANQFYLANNSWWKFDSQTSSWSALPAAFKSQWGVAFGTQQIAGINDGAAFGSTAVAMYDGTTVTGPTQVSAYRPGAIASDGANGFGVVSQQLSNTTMIFHFTFFDGTTWSADTTIGTVPNTFQAQSLDVSLAHVGSTWALRWRSDNNTPGVITGSGTTWTDTTSFDANFGAAIQLTANPVGGTFAVSTSDGDVFVYAGGAWSAKTHMVTNTAEQAVRLTPFADGYVAVVHDITTQNPKLAFYASGAWSTPTVATGVFDPGVVLTHGSAMVFLDPAEAVAQIYSGGTWGTPQTFKTSLTPNSGFYGLAFTGATDTADFALIYPDPGVTSAREFHPASGFGAALTLPQASVAGDVETAAGIWRTPNGHALAVWQQWDNGLITNYADEFDGCAWKTPVALTELPGFVPAVTTVGNTFIISGYAKGLYTWTGSGLAGPAPVGVSPTFLPQYALASDGTTAVVAYADSTKQLVYATSTDGTTWSTPAPIDPATGFGTPKLVGGPGSVLLWASPDNGTTYTARVWQSGTWSAAVTPTHGAGAYACEGAVTTTDALLVCLGAMTADTKLWRGGAWTDVPTAMLDTSVWWLASDGTQYRMLTPYGNSQMLAPDATTWSAPIANPPLGVTVQAAGLAGKANTWTAIGAKATSDVITLSASGSDPLANPIEHDYGQIIDRMSSAQSGQDDLMWVGFGAPLTPPIQLYTLVQ